MDDSISIEGEDGVEVDAGRDLSRRPGSPVSRIHLAHEAPLRLGPLGVEPALRRIAHVDGREDFIQPRVMQVLVALAQARGEILSRDDLLESCWHGVVVGEDAIDRVIARLRRLCEQFAGDDLKLETIPRVGYRLVASPAEPVPVIAPLAPQAEATPVLAVLAFDNLSGDPDFRYFSDGISEEILLTVAKTTGLTVVGRSSSFQFRGADKSARRIAAELGVTHILDGAVRRSGDSVRISAELVDCASQTRLWSDRFDRGLEDVFALQDEIAAAVAEALKARFAPSPAIGPIDPVAYDLYLHARDRTPEHMGFNTKLLEAAIERAPDFAQAWALLAFGRAITFTWNDPGDLEEEGRAGILQAAARALSLDPSAAYAYMALEMAQPLCGHFVQRLALVEKAMAAAPNDALALVHAAGAYDVLGYQRAAYGYVARAYQVDPRHAAFYMPCLLEAVGLKREAQSVLDHDILRWPDSIALRTVALRFAYEAGDWERYDSEFAKLPPDMLADPFFGLLGYQATRQRNWSPADAAVFMGELRAYLDQTGTLPIASLGFPARQGLSEEIFALLDEASFAHLHRSEGRLPFGEFSINVIYLPSFTVLRQDPRFVSLCAKLGLVDHWIRTDLWPDFLTEVAPFYDLKAEARRLSIVG